MLRIAGNGKGGGLGYVTERAASKNVAIRLRADEIVAVVGAVEGDFVEKGGIFQSPVFNAIADFENVVEIGALGDVFDESERGRFGVTD